MMRGFYSKVIGLEILEDSSQKSVLGLAGTPLVILHLEADLPEANPWEAGLYHLAIVYSSRSDLAHAVTRVISQTPELFSGSADHLVSEAFYLSDPEGNGIELYFDRDSSTWEWENGAVKMATLYLPPTDYIREHGTELDKRGTAQIGHVHLKVGDIDQARRFYIDTVGFSMTAQMPSALFMSVHNYHHHLGMNNWESNGAGTRSQTLGLRSFDIQLPSKDHLDALQQRLGEQQVPVILDAEKLVFADPWNNTIVVGSI